MGYSPQGRKESDMTERLHYIYIYLFIPGYLAGKECTCNVGDPGSIPDLGKCLGEGNSYSLQYSGLENSMDCTFHGVTK